MRRVVKLQWTKVSEVGYIWWGRVRSVLYTPIAPDQQSQAGVGMYAVL